MSPFYALHERELLPGNGSQPCQNLDGPQATMYYFAAQFERLLGGMKKLGEEEKTEKRGNKKHFCSEKTWCIPAKSGEYHPLLSLIGIFSATYPAWCGPLFPFCQA